MKEWIDMFEMRVGDRVVSKKNSNGFVNRCVLDELNKIVAKKCTGCLEMMGLEQFSQNAKKFAGKNPKCKKCIKQYNEENKVHVHERHRKYYKKNKERIIERDRKHYEENKERINKRHRKYYEENQERLAERAKQYYKENKELIAERRRMKKSE